MAESKEIERFNKALSKAVSVSRKDLEKRLKEAPHEKEAKHKRFVYRPGIASSSR